MNTTTNTRGSDALHTITETDSNKLEDGRYFSSKTKGGATTTQPFQNGVRSLPYADGLVRGFNDEECLEEEVEEEREKKDEEEEENLITHSRPPSMKGIT
jgi:hypothetical protein